MYHNPDETFSCTFIHELYVVKDDRVPYHQTYNVKDSPQEQERCAKGL